MRDANSDGKERLHIATDQDYEVRLPSEQTGVSFEEARELVQRHGGDWPKLQEEATKLKQSSS